MEKNSSRLKAVNLTKLQDSYKRYVRVVPRQLRVKELSDSWHSRTPDYRLNLTHSKWNKRLSNWRKLVHRWDRISDAQCDLLSDCLKRGDLEGFVSICESSNKESVDFDVCDHLLGQHTADLYYPIIYKPFWFKGDINSNGFQTVDETTFLNKSEQSLNGLDKPFCDNFISTYTNSRL
ncbi:uncharacterized protein TA08190 [Theileria annulata]|uniref:Histone RNA hairpin-binding protein RNA-binding domain-containing protein n=1 Tax=Theileria annulata TaxID=5874 RepID=Q4U9S2_THEAN|nr:uncharacterized protein TA08190 [Theileria annulata]CAI76431.1 hypothetical protein, conserved [Theileria annulata]|eukprot:XP_953056.1 hypothetical protein, conserved [Theileria annulata]